MFGSGFKLELALEEITYTFHHHLDERHPVFDALWHDDCRVDVVALLMGDDALSGSLHITGCHSCLQVDGGSRHRVVDGNLSRSRHVALKVFALDQTYLELAHDVLEVEADRGVGCLDVLAGGKEQVACLVTAGCSCRLRGTLVEGYAERLVCRAAYALYVWVVSVGVVGAFVPIEGACGFPFAAIVGERFVVHEIAAYFEWSLAFCHVETYLVV